MNKYIRLSHIITQDTPSYGNRDCVIIRNNSSIKNRETSNSSFWIFSNNHIGTHIDVPYHFNEMGKKTFDIPINEYFYNKVHLIDIQCDVARLINSEDLIPFLNSIPKDIELLLIRTCYEIFRKDEKYWNDNPGLAPELADYFRKHYPLLRCIGFDFISLTSWKFRDIGKLSHYAFLCPENGGKEILVIEDMSLQNLVGLIKQIIVAPLFVEDGNGGAVTVFAEIEN